MLLWAVKERIYVKNGRKLKPCGNGRDCVSLLRNTICCAAMNERRTDSIASLALGSKLCVCVGCAGIICAYKTMLTRPVTHSLCATTKKRGTPD